MAFQGYFDCLFFLWIDLHVCQLPQPTVTNSWQNCIGARGPISGNVVMHFSRQILSELMTERTVVCLKLPQCFCEETKGCSAVHHTQTLHGKKHQGPVCVDTGNGKTNAHWSRGKSDSATTLYLTMV